MNFQNQKKFANNVILATKIDEIPSEIQKIGEKYLKKQENQVIFLPFEEKTFLLVLVLNDEKNENKRLEQCRVLGHKALQRIQKEELEEISLQSFLAENQTLAFLEGMEISKYSFDKYKTTSVKSQSKISIFLENISEEKRTEQQQVIRSMNIARNLINEPVSYLNTEKFSEEITLLGERYDFSVEVLNKTQIQMLGMGGLLGVNQGSTIPPTFNILTWKPANAVNEQPYVLVGKGVVYDTGGYNVKTGSHMDEMKSDMSGGAAVVGTFCAIAQNKLPIYVIGLIPATDNRISANAFVSDDILTMMNGLSVEIKNTDAEGRLILADALVYAQRFQPKLVIDLATLTGAASRITGHYGSAFMGTASEEIKQELKNIGETIHERLVELPFWDEFGEDLKSSIADLKNLGKPEGGASSAGKFLERFTNYPWIHIDIAGTAFLSHSYKYFKAGATGVGVRLLYHFLKKEITK